MVKVFRDGQGAGKGGRSDDEEAVEHISSHNIAHRNFRVSFANRGYGRYQLWQRSAQGHQTRRNHIFRHAQAIGNFRGAGNQHTRRYDHQYQTTAQHEPAHGQRAQVLGGGLPFIEKLGTPLPRPAIGDVKIERQEQQKKESHPARQYRSGGCCPACQQGYGHKQRGRGDLHPTGAIENIALNGHSGKNADQAED